MIRNKNIAQILRETDFSHNLSLDFSKPNYYRNKKCKSIEPNSMHKTKKTIKNLNERQSYDSFSMRMKKNNL